MNRRNPMAAYAQMQHVGVYAATPLENLIALYQRTLEHIQAARSALQAQDSATVGQSIDKALMILHEGLQPALTPGDTVSENLLALYVYAADQLVKANLERNVAGLDEAEHILTGLLTTWKQLQSQQRSPAKAA